MNLLDRVFDHPDLRSAPPVLVDVGAGGESYPPWRGIARYATGVGFEPDSRSAASTPENKGGFRRWISIGKLVTADEAAVSAELHLAKSSYCSSTLPPDQASLADWAFAGLFAAQGKQTVAAITVARAIAEHGLTSVDWLKCDTQGTDLRIWRSLPAPLRDRNLAVEFEPGLIDAYVGEDKFHHVLAAMECEPFWLASLDVQGATRAPMSMLERRLGMRRSEYYRKYGPSAPAYVNALFLRKVNVADALDLRAHLLLWVFATEAGQPGFACCVAEAGAARFKDELFSELAERSERDMRGALLKTWPRWPRLLWQKLKGNA